jgi:hypothetical protein
MSKRKAIDKRRVFVMGFLQLFSSPWLYVAAAGLCGLCFVSIWQYYIEAKETSILYLFELFLGLSMFKKLAVLFAAVPFAAVFCSDWNCQYIKPVVIRSGIKKYAWSRITLCFLSAFITVFIGLILFFILLSLKMPLFLESDMDNLISEPFASIAYGVMPVMYILAEAAVFSMAAALWSVVGMTVSAYIPNRFVALASPVIACYLLEELTAYLPNFLNIYYLTRSANVIRQGAALSFSYFCFVFVGLSLLSGLLFSRQVRRRIQNEVV